MKHKCDLFFIYFLYTIYSRILKELEFMNTQVHQAFRRPKCNEFCGRIITAVSNIGRLDDRVGNSLSLLHTEIVSI